MARGFFVTGTDTGVGKTVVSGMLIRAIIGLGKRAGALKPVETGCTRSGGLLMASDGAFLRDAAQMDEPVSFVAPCVYETPLSPLAASEIEEKPVDVGLIKERFIALEARYDALVVEGAGGLMVPVREDYYMADMALDMGLPLVVVASPWLGTINHTLLTIHEARRNGIDVAGVVINYSSPEAGTPDEKTNPWMIGRLSKVPVFGVVPYLDELSNEMLGRAAGENLNMDMLRAALGLSQR